MSFNIAQYAASFAKDKPVTVTFPNGKNLTGVLTNAGAILTTEDGDRYTINPENITYVKLPAPEAETDDAE